MHGDPIRLIDMSGLVTTIVIDTGTPGHSGAGINGRVIYDPAGSYRDDVRSSDDTIGSEHANMAGYVDYRRKVADGAVKVYVFNTTTSEEDKLHGSLLDNDKEWNASPGECTVRTIDWLRGIDRFSGLKMVVNPSSLASQLDVMRTRDQAASVMDRIDSIVSDVINGR